MLNFLTRLIRRHYAEDLVREAVEKGIGVYHNCWELAREGGDGIQPEEIYPLALSWCFKTMGLMHRPYGLDYVTLALGATDSDGDELARFKFGLLRPNDFYSRGSVPKQLQDTLKQWKAEGIFRSAKFVSAVMFSWGDLTRELLIAK